MADKMESIAPQEGDEGEKVITPEAWGRGERPRGYQETSTTIRVAHARGIRMHDLFDQSFLSRRDGLIDKAEKQGLTRAEADEMLASSKEVNRVLNEALDAAPSDKK